MNNAKVRQFPDAPGYLAVASVQTADDGFGPPAVAVEVDFKVYRAASPGPTPDRPLFERPGRAGTADLTDDPAGAAVFLSGHVRRDGCSNWRFPDGQLAAHFCGRREAGDLGRLLEALYDWAAEVMPECLDYESGPRDRVPADQESESPCPPRPRPSA